MNDSLGGLSLAQRSVVVFGVYLLSLALVLLAVPNVLLAIFGIPATQEVWIRVVGMLVGFLGYYFAGAPWQLLLFTVFDIFGASWTSWSLQASSRPLAATPQV